MKIYKRKDIVIIEKNNISLVFQNYNLIDYLSPIENIRLVNKSADESILFELGLDKKQIKEML